jgi:hypothetical protein
VALRSELQAIVDALLEASTVTKVIALDAVGDAIGALRITPVEIDAMLGLLEAEGRKITGPDGGEGEARLRKVVTAARELAPILGRPATVAEIAVRADLTADHVRHALTLLKVMQR